MIEITLLTFWVTGVALLISALIGIPAGVWLGMRRFRGRRLIVTLVYTGMGLPPVIAGLIVYLGFSRSGPLGILGWLFTTRSMVVAQILIALPLVIGLTMTAIQGLDPELRFQLRSLGATELQLARALVRQATPGVLVALVTAFGGIISEVGAVMLVGGNIEGKTRVLTTAIVLETRQGHFEQAIALGLVLLSLTFILNTALFQLHAKASR